MIRYKVVRAEGYGALEKQVNEALKFGWELAGGVSVTANSFSYVLGLKGGGEVTSFCVAQAMIMKDPG